MRKLFSLLLVVGSLACGVWVVSQADLAGAWRHVVHSTDAGQRWLLLLALVVPSGIAAVLHTSGWHYAFGRDGAGVHWSRLFGIRLAGEAVNQVTPFLSLGGEPVKAVLFSLGGGDPLRGASAVMSARLVMTAGQVLLVAIAVVLTLARISHAALWAFGLFPAFVGLGITIFSLVRFWFPPAARSWMLARPFIARYREGFRTFSGVLGFWQEHPKECLAALVCFLVGWMAPAAEFWLVARAVGAPLSLLDAIALEGLMTSVTMSTFFIPGNLGSQEAGLLYVCKLLGIEGPVGPLMVVIRRVREILWIAVGLVCLSVYGGSRGEREDGPVLEVIHEPAG
jgi:uncharacterized protein (TIRG00374 family)